MKKLLYKILHKLSLRKSLRFKGKNISKIKRIVRKILLKLKLIKEDKVYTSVGDYHKTLKQFNKKELIRKLVYIRSQALGTPELGSTREYDEMRKSSKRKIINLIVQFTYQLQRT